VKIAHTCIQIACPRKDNRGVIPIFFPVGIFIKSLRSRKLRIEDLTNYNDYNEVWIYSYISCEH
jgi:hypothetical protein